MKVNRFPHAYSMSSIDHATSSIIVIGFAIFALINTPSIKLLTGPTALVNIVALCLLVIGIAIRFKSRSVLASIRLTQYDLIALFCFGLGFAWIAVPELIGLRNSSPGYTMEVLRLAFVFTTFVCVLLVSTERDLQIYLFFQLIWGFLVAITYLGGILQYSREQGQHYNTVSLPIVLALLIVLGLLIVAHNNFEPRELVGLVSIAAILVLGLLSLPGRSPFVGGGFALFIAIVLLAWERPHRLTRRTLFHTAAFGVVLTGILIILFQLGIGSSYLLDRMLNLIRNPTSEPRIELYLMTIEYIINGPFGYGLGAFELYTAYPYPHNLFLHAAFAGGWIAGILVIGGFFVRFKSIFQNTDNQYSSPPLAITMILMYLLFTFMVSYSLGDSYILFTILAATRATSDFSAKRPRTTLQRNRVKAK